MSYLVLARKWRPQAFSAVVGQEHVTRTLQNAIEKGRLAHAIIFSGARGVGKTSIARILAKAINCENGPSPEPCNKCGVCKEITRGNAVDVVEIDGASNRGIDEIRRLRETISYKPVRCRYKVYIIDEVHMLTREAFNALLKTLEEPPGHCYFFFATTEAAKIPDTIRSRCQHFEFRLLSTPEVYAHIEHVVEKESLGLEGPAINLVARAAQGSIRDALSLLDQVSAFGARTAQDVSEALGLIPGELVKALASSIFKGDTYGALMVIEKVHRFGSSMLQLAQDLLHFLRDLLLYREMGETGEGLYVMAMDDLREVVNDVKDPVLIEESIGLLGQYIDKIRYANTPRIIFETCVIRMARLKDLVHIDEVIEKAKNFEGSRHTAPVSVHMPESTPNAPKEGADAPDLEGFLKVLASRSPVLGNILKKARGLELKGPEKEGDPITLLVQCNSQFQEGTLENPKRQKEIQEVAREFFKREVVVEIRSCGPGGEGPGEKSREKGGVSLKRTIHSKRDELIAHPMVQEVLKTFGAKVVEVVTHNKK